MDLARLNFGVPTLIPKVPGEEDIRQFRPIVIALINIIFKMLFISVPYRAPHD